MGKQPQIPPRSVAFVSADAEVEAGILCDGCDSDGDLVRLRNPPTVGDIYICRGCAAKVAACFAENASTSSGPPTGWLPW